MSEGNGRQRKIDRRQAGVAMPVEYAYILLGERFGQPPWVIEDAPADRLAFYLGLLSLEGQYKDDLAGLEPDEPMTWFDEG